MHCTGVIENPTAGHKVCQEGSGLAERNDMKEDDIEGSKEVGVDLSRVASQESQVTTSHDGLWTYLSPGLRRVGCLFEHTDRDHPLSLIPVTAMAGADQE